MNASLCISEYVRKHVADTNTDKYMRKHSVKHSERTRRGNKKHVSSVEVLAYRDRQRCRHGYSDRDVGTETATRRAYTYGHTSSDNNGDNFNQSSINSVGRHRIFPESVNR